MITRIKYIPKDVDWFLFHEESNQSKALINCLLESRRQSNKLFETILDELECDSRPEVLVESVKDLIKQRTSISSTEGYFTWIDDLE